MGLYNFRGDPITTENRSHVIAGEKLIDTSAIVNTGYSGTQHGQYGSNVNLYGDYIDVSDNKVLYIKAPMYAKTTALGLAFGCYDADKNFLYTSGNNDSVKNALLAYSGSLDGIGADASGKIIYNLVYKMATFPDEVKYVLLAGNAAGTQANVANELFLIGREPIKDLWQTWDDYVSTLTADFIAEHDK